MTEKLVVPTPETEAKRRVVRFKTAKGSVYTYDQDGKTTRYKTATGEQEDKQDITVFVNLNLEDQQDILNAYRDRNRIKKTKVYVVERMPDNSSKVLRDVSEVQDPEKLYLAIYEDGNMVRSKEASLEPTVGANVFDTRHYEEEGQWFTERHLGNKVTEIQYAED